MNTNFEDFVLELYDKQRSGGYIVNNRYTFTGCAYMFNSGFSFSKVDRAFFEKNKESIDSVYLISNVKDFEKQIFKSQYQSHEYVPSTNLLKIQLRDKELEILLK